MVMLMTSPTRKEIVPGMMDVVAILLITALILAVLGIMSMIIAMLTI
jgi:hypothetical protein